MLESSKSYTRKIYVGNIGAYPRQTSIISDFHYSIVVYQTSIIVL
jgi:hypothetical protein